MEPFKVLIVDDSVVYRSQIREALSAFPWIDVVGAASSGRLAISRLEHAPVDLVILDLEMPEMDGLQLLGEFARLKITAKSLVFSSASKRGAEITFDALRLGAKDFVSKPGGELLPGEKSFSPAERIRAVLEPKIRAILHFGEAVTISPSPSPTVTETYPRILWDVFRPEIVVVGSSTGGPTVLERIFGALGGTPNVPILVVQHMPPVFTASLAERIEKLSGIRAKEGEHGEAVRPGTIYIAPGDFHMTVGGSVTSPIIRIEKAPQVNSVRPAVDPLFRSAANIFRAGCLGVVLTGMGQDGMAGAMAVKKCGGAVMIQDRESSVVYGMPGAVLEAGAYDRVGTPDDVATALREKIVSFHSFSSTGRVQNA